MTTSERDLLPNATPALSECNAISTSSLDVKDAEFLDFEGSTDKGNPYNWSESRKWFVTAVALMGTLTMPMNGTSITVAADQINRQFGVSDTDTFTNSYWPVTSWTIGGVFFVLFGLPILEDTGLRRGYLAFYAFFVIMVIPQAVAQNFATLIVTRFFSGGCVALLSNAIASIIPDLWETEKARSLPVSLYILFYVMGDTLGPPVFSGVIQHIGNWRWYVVDI